MIPALMIPLFFFVVNVGALQDFSEQGIAGFDYKAFQLPVAIIFAVTGISRAGTLVLDIQDGYFDRLLMTPVKRLALLLGLMVADFALVCGLCIPVMGLGFALGVRFETGRVRHARLHPARRVLGPRVHRLPLRHRPEDRQPERGGVELHPVLPVRFLTTSTLPARPSPGGWTRWPATTPSPTCSTGCGR